jgi:RNA polymerase sigma factor (sigma-70 family)
MSETELLQAFRKERSEEAFAELVRRYAGLVYSVAHRRLSNAALAEDVTQLVFIRFAKTPPKVNSAGELAAWLHRTTVNVTIDTWRSETRRRNREQEAVAMQQPEPTATTQAFWDEISPGLDEAIDQLNDDDREAILLRFFKAKPMRDVGAALGVSEAAAKMRVGRAVDKLRTQLGAGAAATTAVVLAVVLAERSAQAAPVQLVSRLAAMKLPAASVAGKGAVIHSLSRISKAKVVVGAAGVALVAISVLHFSRPSAPVAQATSHNVSAARTEQHASPVAPAQADLPALAPPKGVRIQFHVLDAETDAGLGQTKIQFYYLGAGGHWERHDTVTDAKGDAAITEPDDPSNHRGLDVSVTAEGHVPKGVNFKTTPPADYTVRLDPAETANGIVVDEQRSPVSDVAILPGALGNATGIGDGNFDIYSPMTNHEDGSWSCSYIPKGARELNLFLDKPGYAQTRIVMSVNEVGLSNLTLVIDRGYKITGKISDARGKPIANAEIKDLSGVWRKRSTLSNGNGMFVLTGIRGEAATNQTYAGWKRETNDSGFIVVHAMSPVETNEGEVLHGIAAPGPQKVDVSVQAEGFAPQMKTVALSTMPNEVDFVLAAGNILRGQVVDEASNPISNAVVQTDFDFDFDGLHPEKDNQRPPLRGIDWWALTDGDGYFQWNSAPEEDIWYWFEADGYEPIRTLKLAADGNEHRIVLKASSAKR